MSRQSDPGFDPRIADWLEADPDQAPPEVLRTVESALPSIPQRRALRLPWRNLPMNKLVPIGATILLLAALGAGAVAVGSRPSTTTPTPTAPAALAASPAPGVTTESYRAARDKVCKAAAALADPVKARLAPLYDEASTPAQKAGAIAAIREVVALGTDLAAKLSALDVPPELVAEHAANIANNRDILILLRESLALHDAGKTAEALAVDLATDGISEQMNAFEIRYGLAPCP
jgi:hypothetical protein